MNRRAASTRARVCLGALALAAIVVPAMHAEVHAREAAADAAAAVTPIAIAPGHGPIIRVTHHVSVEIDGPPGHHHHHHHDGDRPGDHGADAPEHFSFALAPATPPILPPPFVAIASIDPIPPCAPLAGARALDTHRNRRPPANA